MVLEEVVLSAVVDDGRWVAATSARRIAEAVGLDPGTVAAALRRLRRLGVLVLAQDRTAGGRFGLSTYELGLLLGIAPRTVHPHTASQQPATPGPVPPAPVIPAPVAATAAATGRSSSGACADRAAHPQGASADRVVHPAGASSPLVVELPFGSDAGSGW